MDKTAGRTTAAGSVASARSLLRGGYDFIRSKLLGRELLLRLALNVRKWLNKNGQRNLVVKDSFGQINRAKLSHKQNGSAAIALPKLFFLPA